MTKFGIPPRPLLVFLFWALHSHIESLWRSSDSKTFSIAFTICVSMVYWKLQFSSTDIQCSPTHNYDCNYVLLRLCSPCNYVPPPTTFPLRLRVITTWSSKEDLQNLRFSRICRDFLHSAFLRLTREPLKACTPLPLLSWYSWVLSSLSHS